MRAYIFRARADTAASGVENVAVLLISFDETSQIITEASEGNPVTGPYLNIYGEALAISKDHPMRPAVPTLCKSSLCLVSVSSTVEAGQEWYCHFYLTMNYTAARSGL